LVSAGEIVLAVILWLMAPLALAVELEDRKAKLRAEWGLIRTLEAATKDLGYTFVVYRRPEKAIVG